MQLVNNVQPLECSPVWFALATDEQFLNRQIKDLEDVPDIAVVSARLKEIEERNHDLLDKFKAFLSQKLEAPAEIKIGELYFLSGKELNAIASQLPAKAGRLLTDSQLTAIDFHLFTGEQLDEIIACEGTDEAIQRRLGRLIAPDQKENLRAFLEKSSGCHFTKFPDSFYAHLSLSNLTEKMIEALFDDYYGLKKEEAMHRIRLVSPEEISNNFHLLNGKHARMLSDSQLKALDYSRMNADQLDDLFGLYHFIMEKDELKRRIQLVPEAYVNDIIKTKSPIRTNARIIEFFSPKQFAALDTALLDQDTVRELFPGFTIDTLHPGYEFKKREHPMGTRYEFHYKGGMYGYSKEELDAKCTTNKEKCLNMASRFSADQLKAMLPLMYPECQALLNK